MNFNNLFVQFSSHRIVQSFKIFVEGKRSNILFIITKILEVAVNTGYLVVGFFIILYCKKL